MNTIIEMKNVLRKQITSLTNALGSLEEIDLQASIVPFGQTHATVSRQESTVQAQQSASSEGATGRRATRRKMSAEGRKRISEASKQRWAKARGANGKGQRQEMSTQ